MKKDINNLRSFNDWINLNFTWIDPRVKSFMRRAWCARGKIERDIKKLKK